MANPDCVITIKFKDTIEVKRLLAIMNIDLCHIKYELKQTKMSREWIRIEDRLPTKETIHSGKCGVSVLYYDEVEAKDYGYFNPYICSFSFVKQVFLGQSPGLNDLEYGDWVPVELTHWIPLPGTPKEIL